MTRRRELSARSALVLGTLAILIGMCAGFFLYRTVKMRMAMIELDRHAWRYMLRAEESSNTSERFLKAMAAAGLPACSEAEIAYMHRILFQSEYLKDGGRMRNGTVQCDAMFRESELSRKTFKPDFVLKDGTEVYTDIRVVAGDPEARIGVQRGGFFVSYLHWRPDRLGDLPLKFTLTEVADTRTSPGWLHGERVPASASLLAKDGWLSVGNNLYATHCSPRYFNCFTAFVDIQAVLATQVQQAAIATAVGGVIGGICALLCMLLYRRNQSMVNQLRRAIRTGSLHMVYQPIVNLRTRQVIGAEALVRWTDVDGFPVSPQMFVNAAEEHGFGGELTELVIGLVLRDLGDDLRRNRDLSININVTGTDLADPEFLVVLQRSLAAARVPASSLTIELTESSTADNEAAPETTHKLRERGHRVYIDDFGTGYSNLSYLHSLAVDAIKIDKSFTHAIGTEGVTLSILPQILAMAKTLVLEVVAEGIETEEQAEYFAQYDQTIWGQGWLFGRPVTAEQFHLLLVAREASAAVLV